MSPLNLVNDAHLENEEQPGGASVLRALIQSALSGGLDAAESSRPRVDRGTATALSILQNQAPFDPGMDPGPLGQISNAILPLVLGHVQGQQLYEQEQQRAALGRMEVLGNLVQLAKEGVDIENTQEWHALQKETQAEIRQAISEGREVPYDWSLGPRGMTLKSRRPTKSQLTSATNEVLLSRGIAPEEASPEQIARARQQVLSEKKRPNETAAAVRDFTNTARQVMGGFRVNPDGTITLAPRPEDAAKARDNIRNLRIGRTVLDRYEEAILKDPRVVGASGDVMGALQGLKGQSENFRQLLLGDRSEVMKTIYKRKDDPKLLTQLANPSLSDAELFGNMSAYRLALFQNPDKRISGADFDAAKEQLGLNRKLINPYDVLTRIRSIRGLFGELERMESEELSGPGVSGAQSSPTVPAAARFKQLVDALKPKLPPSTPDSVIKSAAYEVMAGEGYQPGE
jgi:hypothetical protein